MNVHARDADFVAVGKSRCTDGDLDEGGGDDVLGAMRGGEDEAAGNYTSAAYADVADEEWETQTDVGEEEST